jgi:hypothetical protein
VVVVESFKDTVRNGAFGESIEEAPLCITHIIVPLQ